MQFGNEMPDVLAIQRLQGGCLGQLEQILQIAPVVFHRQRR